VDDLNLHLVVLPHDLFLNRLPNGEKEFFCFVCFPDGNMKQAKHFSWKIASNTTGVVIKGEQSITDIDCKQNRVSVSALLPSEFEGGELMVRLAPCEETWQIQSYNQKGKFRLPLEGQVLVLGGHRLGEPHRSAQIASQHFAWDLLPLHNDGLRLLRGPLLENLEVQDFTAFGQSVLAPAEGVIVKAVDGMADLTYIGELPTNLDYYREDLTRALGNHVIVDHGNGVWSLLAHLKSGSVRVKEGQEVKISDELGGLGSSGFGSGPHLHLHFMNGPDVLSASPLPIELDLEGGTYAPQAGEITSS
jgi:hypothetical protein